MRTRLALLIIGSLAVASAGTVRAADEETPAAVVVTATGIPTPEVQIASSITVITAEEIAAAQQQTLADVLRNVPGLNLIRTGGPGGLTTIFMRGTNANHTKVLVDGIDVSDPSSPSASFDFGQFLAQDIERVEVLRGPQSGLYGSDAIGGVINIITRSGSGPAQLSAAVEGGSFDTFNQTASLRGADDRFHYSFNLEHLHTGATPVTPLDTLAPGEPRNDDYYDNLTASTKLGFDVDKDFDLSLVTRYTETHLRETADDDILFGFPDPTQSQSNTSAWYARGGAHLVSFAGFLDQTLGIAYARDSTASYTPGSPESPATGERTKIDWRGALHLSDGEMLLLGAEHAQDRISQPLAASIDIDSGYAELESQLGERVFSALNVRYDANQRFGSKATYRIAPAYLLPETDTKLKASVGSGFKAPTLSELFQSFPPFFFANPNLKPESSIGYDLGIEQGWREERVQAGVTYFNNRIRNLIVSDVTGTTYANIGRATTDGVETFLAYRPTKTLTMRADYTYTQATDDVLHEELIRRPKQKGTLSALWQATPALSFDSSVLTVGSWVDGNRDFSIPRLRAPGYTVVNFATTYELSGRWSVYGRIDNLLDRHYENPFGFLQPSVGFFAGVRAKL